MAEEFQKKKVELIYSIINKIERSVFTISLPFIVLFILPLPWANFEYGRGLSMLFFGGTLLVLELVKFLLTGRISVFKSKMDNILGLVIISGLISAVFSQDFMLSVLGYSYNLGAGFLFLSLSLIYFYVFRSFIKDEAELNQFVKYFILIVVVGTIISIISFFHVNLGSYNDIANKIFSYGSPVFENARYLGIIWISILILAIGYILVIGNRVKLWNNVLLSFSVLILMLATILSSFIANQFLLIILLVGLLSFSVVIYAVKGLTEKYNRILFFTVISIALMAFILSFIPSIKSSIENINPNYQTGIAIDLDRTWQTMISTMSENFKNGVLGIGYDNFSISVNRYLTSYSSVVDDTDTYIPFSEVLRIGVEAGLFGVIMYLIAIYYAMSSFYKDLVRVHGRVTGSQYIQMASGVVINFILIVGLFYGLSSYVYFILFGFITIYVLSRSFAVPRDAEMFVIEVDFLVESITKKKTQFVPWIIIISASLLLCGVYFFSLANLASAVSVLKGEYLVKQAQDKLLQSNLTQDQQKTELNKAISLYTDAINSARWNYILYRRVSLLYVEYVQILGNQYSSAASQIEKESLLKDITRYAGNATDNAVRSTDISSVVLRNWTNRISVYYDIISLGLSNYLPQGIDSVTGAKKVSPYNNVLYYYESQFLLLEAKPNDALNALTKSLYYNPKHIPSLIVAGDIEYGNKSWTNSRNYYQQALDLLKESDGINSDMYKSIQSRIEEINKKVAE